MKAEDLLAYMRPEVERVLVLLGVLSPPSQSARVTTAIEKIDEMMKNHSEYKEHTMSKDIWWSQFREISRARRLLMDFGAVHRTVWILEGRAL